MNMIGLWIVLGIFVVLCLIGLALHEMDWQSLLVFCAIAGSMKLISDSIEWWPISFFCYYMIGLDFILLMWVSKGKLLIG